MPDCWPRALLFAGAVSAMAAYPAFGQGITGTSAGAQAVTDVPTVSPTTTAPPVQNAISEYFAHWFDRVNEAQATQPHRITPLVTVTPRLEEEVRADAYIEHLGNGASVTSYGNGKGLELIPTTTNEVIITAPTYLERGTVRPASGYGDWPFILIKQRLLSANEQNGNYIVTAFLGATAPIGSRLFTNRAWIITPTIAGGKGWGDFSVQATLAASFPTAHVHTIGQAIAGNVAFQYHTLKYLWPEVEVNWTYWPDGLHAGKNQIFITPGIIFGRFELGGRLKANFGFGYQVAVSPTLTKTPVLTPVYNHAWVVTGRVSF